MKHKKRSLMRWFGSLRLSHKMMTSVGFLFFCSNLFILLLIGHMVTSSLKQKACEQLQGQLTITLSAMGSSISDITGLMANLASASDMADYIEQGTKYETQYLDIVNGVNESMRILLRANTMVDYVALLLLNQEGFLYNGESQSPVQEDPRYDIRQILLDNYKGAKGFLNSSFQYNVLRENYRDPELNLFYPICRRYEQPGEAPAALLVAGINTRKMHRYVAAENENLHIRLLTADGMVLVSERPEQTGQMEEQIVWYQEKAGQFARGDELVVYQYGPGGVMWIADGTISQKVLFSGVSRMTVILTVVIVLCTLLTIAVITFCCDRFYAPMQEIVLHMQQVSKGNLNEKMRIYEENDFRHLSDGFNCMTESIRELIEEAHRQEQKMTEIRLNALQSQIQPHFLYNTLECVHWQALSDGNAEVSRIVMALSKYYRICLSKGADLVPLSQEIEHIKSYVTIQNMRFDNIIQVEYRIADELLGMMLPKITLQPLVENAIYHGIKTEEERKGHLILTGQKKDGFVLLTVEDDGVGMAADEMEKLNKTINVFINDGSYGVKNVHQRIAIRYGEAYGLSYRANAYGGVTVEIRLPDADGGKEAGREGEVFVQHIDCG